MKAQKLINLVDELYNGPSWDASQPGAAGPGPMTQTIPEQGGDYIATKQGMKKGYWKVMNIKTGDVVQSGITTKSVADGIAQKWNQGYYKSFRGAPSAYESQKGEMLLSLEWNPKRKNFTVKMDQKQIDLMHWLTREAHLPEPKGGGTLFVSDGEDYEKLLRAASDNNVAIETVGYDVE